MFILIRSAWPNGVLFAPCDAGSVYWVYEEGGVRPDPDHVAAQQTEIAVTNLQFNSPKSIRGTGEQTVLIPNHRHSSLIPSYSKIAPNRRGSGIGLSYGFYEYGLLDRYRMKQKAVSLAEPSPIRRSTIGLPGRKQGSLLTSQSDRSVSTAMRWPLPG